MTTARTIVESALSIIGVKQAGQSLGPEEAQLGLERLNDMLDAWAIESLYAFSTNEYSGFATASTITIGPTGTIVVPFVPLRLEHAFARFSNIDRQIDLVNYDEFASISLKSVLGPWPRVGYYDDGSGIFSLYPVPSHVEIHVGVYSRLSEFTSLNTDVVLRPGTRRCLQLSLAEDLADDFSRPLPPTLEQRALRARRVLKRSNHVTPQLEGYESAGGSLYPPGFSGDNYDGAIDNT
jgi:hypothetical protein